MTFRKIVCLTLNSGDKIEGVLLSCDDEAYLRIRRADGVEKPYSYALIGEAEKAGAQDAARPARKEAGFFRTLFGGMFPSMTEDKGEGPVQAEESAPRPHPYKPPFKAPDTTVQHAGFLDKYLPEHAIWIIHDFDNPDMTYSFKSNNVEDEHVFNILRDESLWEKYPLAFSVKFHRTDFKGRQRYIAVNLRLCGPDGPHTGTLIKYDPASSHGIIRDNADNHTFGFVKADVKDARADEVLDNAELRYRRPVAFLRKSFNNKTFAKNIFFINVKVKPNIKDPAILEKIAELVQAENYPAALETLVANSGGFPINDYYTKYVEIHEKIAKDDSAEHIKELLASLDKAIAANISDKLRAHFIQKKAFALQKTRDLHEIVKTFNQYISVANNMGISPVHRENVLVAAAKHIAQIKWTEPDYIVPSPLKEEIERNERAASIANDPREQNSLEDPVGILLDNPRRKISPFVLSKLNEYNLAENARINMLDDNGCFIGTVKEALAEYERITSRIKIKGGSTLTPTKRSDAFRQAARILYDALTNDTAPAANEEDLRKAWEDFFYSIGASFIAFGDYALKNTEDQIDTARYYYYEGLKYIVADSTDGESQDMHNAAIRLVTSFFLGRSDIPLPAYGQDTANNLSYNKIGELLKNVHASARQIDEFGNFIFQTLTDETFPHIWLLTPLFHSVIGADLAGKLYRLLKKESKEPPKNRAQAETLLSSLNYHYFSEKQAFLKSLGIFNDFSFIPGWLDGISGEVEKLDAFSQYMVHCDAEYLNQVKTWISYANEFNKNTNCDRKAELLKLIISGVEDLDKRIHTVPSKIAFENILGLLPRIKESAEQAFLNLCASNPPDIQIGLSGEKEVRLNDDTILLQINVRNAHNCMAADSLTLNIGGSDVFSVLTPDTSVAYLREDESKLFQINLRLHGKATKVLTANIRVDYTRKTSFDSGAEESKEQTVTVQLTDEKFEPTDNPYRKYSGGNALVEDEKMFFGRREFIDGIISQMIDENGRLLKGKSILLYGQKRTGKSSILVHLKERIRKASPNSIIVDFGDIGVESPEENFGAIFAHKLCKFLGEDLEKDHAELLDAMKGRGINIPRIGFEMSEAQARPLVNEFLHDFTRFLDEKPGGREYNIVIMIDEFTTIYTWIQQGRMDDNFMLFWKGAVNDYKLVGILVGKDTMPDFINAFPNQFAASQHNPVTYLPDDESERMITNPPAKRKLMFDGEPGKDAIKRIKELTANSAFYNMILLDRLVRFMNDEGRRWVSGADIENLCEKSIFGGTNPLKPSDFDPLYNDSDEADKQRIRHNLVILWTIANSSEVNGSFKQGALMDIREELNDPSLTKERIDSILQKLIDRDVIERNINEGLRIKVGLFYEWLRKHCSPKTINDHCAARGARSMS